MRLLSEVTWPTLVYGSDPYKTRSSQCRRFCHVGEGVRIPPTKVVDELRGDIEVVELVLLVAVLSSGLPLLWRGWVLQCRKTCSQVVTGLERSPIVGVPVVVVAFVALDAPVVVVPVVLSEVVQSGGNVLES